MSNDSMPLVSVIVPVYNARQWLPESFESWERQTYLNVEWILVDDGSQDGSCTLCEAWVARDPVRRILIKKTNGGASSARNLGLRKAKGQYVTFWDADDKQDADALEVMVAGSAGFPVVVCPIHRVEIGYSHRDLFASKEHVTNSKEALNEWLRGGVSTGPYSKLVSRKMLLEREIRFEEGVINEDVLWTAKILSAAGSIHFLNRAVYSYVSRSNSVTGSFGPRIVDVFGNCRKLESHVAKNYPELSEACAEYCARQCWGVALASARRRNYETYPGVYQRARKEMQARSKDFHAASAKERLLLLLYWSGLYRLLRE